MSLYFGFAFCLWTTKKGPSLFCCGQFNVHHNHSVDLLSFSIQWTGYSLVWIGRYHIFRRPVVLYTFTAMDMKRYMLAYMNNYFGIHQHTYLCVQIKTYIGSYTSRRNCGHGLFALNVMWTRIIMMLTILRGMLTWQKKMFL